MPDPRISGAAATDQAMTIPDRIKAALKAAGRFEVGSEVYLPDRDQTLRVVRLDFMSGKKGKKGVWLRWESECVDCGQPYQFTTKRSFAYPTRTCEKHRKSGARAVAAPRVEARAADEVLLRAAIEVLTGFSLLSGIVAAAEVQDEIAKKVYGAVVRRPDPRVRGLWAALATAIEDGLAPGAVSVDDQHVIFE